MPLIALFFIITFSVKAQQLKEPPVTGADWLKPDEPCGVASNLYSAGTFDFAPLPKPTYTGTWILNLDKSKLQSERAKKITKCIFIITQEGDRFSLERYHIFGDRTKKLRFHLTADGKTRKMKLLFKEKLEWLNDDVKASVWRKNFSNIVHYKFGDTQNELIADETFTSSSLNYHNYWVFEREIQQ